MAAETGKVAVRVLTKGIHILWLEGEGEGGVKGSQVSGLSQGVAGGDISSEEEE